jgi:hypothetical protein
LLLSFSESEYAGLKMFDLESRRPFSLPDNPVYQRPHLGSAARFGNREIGRRTERGAQRSCKVERKMNDIEREAIILNSAWEMIDGMVNWAMFVKNDSTEPTNLMFATHMHSRLFVILLGDFLAEIRAFKGDPVPLGLKPAPSNARPSDLTFLFHLRQVCADPKLGTDTAALSAAIETFADWLEGEFIAPGVNLNAIEVVADLRVERFRYIKMCADITKHSLARLATNVGHLRRLLEAAGHAVSEQEAYLAVENFFEWFHDDIFIYHSSQIGEFLNNIRWAIYDYLQPEFQRSWHPIVGATPQFPIYSYRVPTEIMEPVAHSMYWDAMNRSRSKPYVQRFIVTESLKRRY